MQQNSPQLMYGYVVSTKTVTQPTNDVIFYLTNRRLGLGSSIYSISHGKKQKYKCISIIQLNRIYE